MTVRLTTDAFDPSALLAEFSQGRTETGAVVTFTGIARASDGAVRRLELEAYPGFTDTEIARIAAATKAKFSLHDVLIVHRYGEIAPGEPIVFVATAAGHRRAAFQAADQLMDYLKSRAPFWKREHGSHGVRWVEPTEQDLSDAKRWD